MPARAKVDYDRIEPDWRAGIKTPRQLADEYTAATGVSVSHTAIIKHFAKAGVDRDLAAKVQAKADALVMQAEVTGKVTPKVSSVTLAEEKKIIEANAVSVATVRMDHRQDIRKARDLGMRLFEELETETGSLGDLVALGEMMRKPDDRGVDKMNDLYLKVLSMPGRVDSMKKLSDTLKTLIGLEREAYGMKIEAENPQGLRAVHVTDADARL